MRVASKRRNDGLHEKLQDKDHVIVHVACRKSYTREDTIRAAVNKAPTTDSESSSPVKAKLRTKEALKLKNKCLFCFEEISELSLEKEKKKPLGKRRKVSEVRSIPLRDTILEQAKARNDKWGKAVAKRVINVVDLVAADAKYHQSCFTDFFRNPIQTGFKRGRPPDEDIQSTMHEIYSCLENSDDCQFSMKELLDQVTGYVPDERTVKENLKKRYGEEVIITSHRPKGTTVCFRDTGYKLLTNSWYNDRKVDKQQERLRIVQAAADIIREDIRSEYHDVTSYPDFNDLPNIVTNGIPESLDVLLKRIILKRRKGNVQLVEKKCITIAHAIQWLQGHDRSFPQCS
jgi:hypothetical protein